MNFPRLIRRCFTLSRQERSEWIEIIIALVSARLAVSTRPMAKLLIPGQRPFIPPPEADLNRMARRIARASRWIPRATCLVQALALHRLAARRHWLSELKIGVRTSDGRFSAHAWVEVEGRVILGWHPDPHQPLLVVS